MAPPATVTSRGLRWSRPFSPRPSVLPRPDPPRLFPSCPPTAMPAQASPGHLCPGLLPRTVLGLPAPHCLLTLCPRMADGVFLRRRCDSAVPWPKPSSPRPQTRPTLWAWCSKPSGPGLAESQPGPHTSSPWLLGTPSLQLPQALAHAGPPAATPPLLLLPCCLAGPYTSLRDLLSPTPLRPSSGLHCPCASVFKELNLRALEALRALETGAESEPPAARPGPPCS